LVDLKVVSLVVTRVGEMVLKKVWQKGDRMVVLLVEKLVVELVSTLVVDSGE
jgi:hypothetical protein